MAQPTTTGTSAAEVISAIAQLWKLAACIALPLTIYILREPLAKVLPTLRRIKRGNTEIELLQNEKKEAPHEIESAAKEAPPQDKAEPSIEEATGEIQSLGSQVGIAIWRRDNSRAEALFLQWLEAEPEKKIDLEVFYYTMLCDFQKDYTAVEKLRSFVEDQAYAAHVPGILRTIGSFFEAVGQYDKALSFFEDSGKRANKDEEKVRAIIECSRIHASTDRAPQALDLLHRAFAEFSDDDSLARLYAAAAEVFRSTDNELGRCAALEKLLQYRPTDTRALFDAAYAQSAAHIPHLAMHNYLLELDLDPRDVDARNNYAVQLGELGLSAKSTDQYLLAVEDGSTLAAANLAYLYLDKGLVKDAERILRDAQSKDTYHVNVDSALTQLHTILESEDEAIKAVARWAIKYQKFLRAYAEYLLVPKVKRHRFGGNWVTEQNVRVHIEQEDSRIRAKWGDKHRHRKFEGIQTNHSATVKLYHEILSLFVEDAQPNYGNPVDALAYLSDDGTEIKLLTFGEDEPQEMVLRRA